MILLKHKIRIFLFSITKFYFFCLMQGFRVFVFSSRIDHILLPHCSKKYPRDFTAYWCFSPFSCLKKPLVFVAFYLVLLGCRVPIPLTKRLHGPYQRKLNGNGMTPQHSQYILPGTRVPEPMWRTQTGKWHHGGHSCNHRNYRAIPAPNCNCLMRQQERRRSGARIRAATQGRART